MICQNAKKSPKHKRHLIGVVTIFSAFLSAAGTLEEAYAQSDQLPPPDQVGVSTGASSGQADQQAVEQTPARIDRDLLRRINEKELGVFANIYFEALRSGATSATLPAGLNDVEAFRKITSADEFAGIIAAFRASKQAPVVQQMPNVVTTTTPPTLSSGVTNNSNSASPSVSGE